MSGLRKAIKKCPVCGKIVYLEKYDSSKYVYRERTKSGKQVYFCGWNCFQSWRRINSPEILTSNA